MACATLITSLTICFSGFLTFNTQPFCDTVIYLLAWKNSMIGVYLTQLKKLMMSFEVKKSKDSTIN